MTPDMTMLPFTLRAEKERTKKEKEWGGSKRRQKN